MALVKLPEKNNTEENKIIPKPRPEVISGRTIKITTGCGNLYVTINVNGDAMPFELFAQMGKTGGCAASHLEAIARLCSLALRSGIKSYLLTEQLSGVRCPNPVLAKGKGKRILSCSDAIAKALEDCLEVNKD